MIKVNINLSAIPKSLIVEGKKGKYVNVIINKMKQPDPYGNTHTVYLEQSKEEREAKAEKVYIGKGKEVTFNGAAPQQDDDLPF